MSQASATFDPIHLVQEMWKGFCLPPNQDDAQTNVGHSIDEHQYEQRFLSSATPTVTKDVPRCIDLTSNVVIESHKATDKVDLDRRRLHSYEFDNYDCNNTTASFAAIISHDSYDDDNSDDHNKRDFDDYASDEKHDVPEDTIMALSGGCTNRTTRVSKGLEFFISALLFIASTIYMIQKLQQESQPSSHNFHLHSKIDHGASFWRWHLK